MEGLGSRAHRMRRCVKKMARVQVTTARRRRIAGRRASQRRAQRQIMAAAWHSCKAREIWTAARCAASSLTWKQEATPVTAAGLRPFDKR